MSYLERNKRILEELESQTLDMDTLTNKLSGLCVCTDFLMKRATTYYSSPILEKMLESIALDTPTESTYEANSILIIYTKVDGSCKELYLTIKDELSKYYRIDTYTLQLFNFLTNPNADFLMEESRKLREIASKYEKIFYISHYCDVVPNLALIKNFTRPIILCNPSNYIFNFGNSLADIWIDMTKDDMLTSINKRCIDQDIVTYLPLKYRNLEAPKIERAGTHIYSCGGWHKYIPLDRYNNFFNLCLRILNSREDIHITVSGIPTETCPFYKEVKNLHKRLHILGYLDHSTHLDNIKNCDIFLDSYPINGYTTCLEVVSMGKNIVSLRSNGGTYQETHTTIFDTQEEVIDYILNPYDSTHPNFLREHRDTWASKLLSIVESCPKTHQAREVMRVPSPITDYEISKEADINNNPYFTLIQFFHKYTALLDLQNTFRREELTKRADFPNLFNFDLIK